MIYVPQKMLIIVCFLDANEENVDDSAFNFYFRLIIVFYLLFYRFYLCVCVFLLLFYIVYVCVFVCV